MSNTYVVLFLISFYQSCRFEEGCKKTRFKQKTLNPVFNEIFQFKLPHAHLATTKLRAVLWDHDFFGEDDFNGEAVIDLSRVYLGAGTHTDWHMLQLQVWKEKGIVCSLKLIFFRFVCHGIQQSTVGHKICPISDVL